MMLYRDLEPGETPRAGDRSIDQDYDWFILDAGDVENCPAGPVQRPIDITPFINLVGLLEIGLGNVEDLTPAKNLIKSLQCTS